MEYYQNVLCLTYSDFDGVLPYETLKSAVKNNRCHLLRRGYGRDTYALIQWSSLPNKYQQLFRQCVGDPVLIMKEAEAKRLREQRHDPEAVDFFNKFTYILKGKSRHLAPKIIEEYIRNATALKELLAEFQHRQRVIKASGNTKGDQWDILLQSSEALRKSYPHTLPKNKDRLRKAVMAFKDFGMGSVVSGKLGNSNTRKITDEGVDYLIALRRCRVPVLTMEEILEKYNEKARAEGWKEITDNSTFYKIIRQTDKLARWYDAAHGEQKARQKFDRKHTTELPMLANTIWYGDGTKLNLYYRDDDGNVRTIMVYEVMDAASEVLLGYHISESEDYKAQCRAYRMAVEKAGVKPMEVVYDNQGGHKKLEAQQFFSKLAVRHRPTAPYNGSSKTIENAFYRFQREILAKKWYFTGQNITAKMESSRPNIEFIEANKANLPTLDELKATYAALREEWNSRQHPTAGMSREEVYRNSPNPDCPRVTEYDIMEMFWLTTTRPATFTANGLRITLRDREYLYEVYERQGIPDYRWITEHVDAKFFVQYDPLDIQSVRLLDAEDRHLVAVAGLKRTIHRAATEQTDDERKFIRESREAVQRERARRIAEGRELEIRYGFAPEQHGLNSPKPKNLPKDIAEQMEQRLASARRRKLLEDGLGEHTKVVSLADWMTPEEDRSDELDRIRAKY